MVAPAPEPLLPFRLIVLDSLALFTPEEDTPLIINFKRQDSGT